MCVPLHFFFDDAQDFARRSRKKVKPLKRMENTKSVFMLVFKGFGDI